MQSHNKNIFGKILHILIFWLVNSISLLITSWIVPGIDLVSIEGNSILIIAIAASLLLALINFLIRPLLLLITVPIGWMVVFIAGFLILLSMVWKIH